MSRRNNQPNEESFLKDVSKHEMTVKLDNGVYRHLRFGQPNSSNMWFDIVTWPGFLAYTGDMGSFVFTRSSDMFEFFRTDSKKGGLGINLNYWSEKLEAVDRDGRSGSYKDFSPERMRVHVEEHVAQWIEECELSEDAAAELKEAVEEEVYRYLDDSEHEARTAVRDFSVEIDGHKDTAAVMVSAESSFDLLIDQLVVDDGGLTTHPADHSNGFHPV